MKKITLSLLFCFLVFISWTQSRVYQSQKASYSQIFQFDKVEITPTQTIATVRLCGFPSYWVILDSNSYLEESDGERKYKLIGTENFEFGKKVSFNEFGETELKMIFEPIPTDVKRVDFILHNSDTKANTYGLSLAAENKDVLPDSFYGNWILADGSNRWICGLHESVVIIDNDIWDYKFVKKKGSVVELNLSNKNTEKTIFVKLSKKGDLLLSRDNKSFVACGRQFIENKDRKSDWVFSPEKYRDSIYNPGKAVLRGYLDGYNPKFGFRIAAIRVEDEVLRKSNSILVDIQPDGRFETELELEHLTCIFSRELGTEVWVAPNDTIVVYNNFSVAYNIKNMRERSNNSLIYMGGTSSELNNMFPIITKLMPSSNLKIDNPRDIERMTAQQVMKMLHLYYDKLIDIQKVAPIVFDRYNMSDYTKDLLLTDFLANTTVDILDIMNYYNRNSVLMKNIGNGVNVGIDNPDYIPLSGHLDFLQSIKSSVLDNPLVIASSTFMILINRFEYSEVAGSLDIDRNKQKAYRKKLMDELLEKEKLKLSDTTKRWIDKFVNSSQYPVWDPNLPAEILKIKDLYLKYSEQNPLKFSSYSETLVDIFNNLKSHNLEKCILYDYTVSRLAVLGNRSDKMDIANTISYIKTPYVIGKFLQYYVDKMPSSVAVKTSISSKKMDEVFNKIIAPYKGNVLVIDFWSTGCGPCRTGMIGAKDMVERYKDRKIKFLYITDESQSPIDEYHNFLKKNNIKGEQIRVTKDEWNYLASKFSIDGIPHYVILNKKGEIILNGNVHFDEELLNTLEKE